MVQISGDGAKATALRDAISRLESAAQGVAARQEGAVHECQRAAVNVVNQVRTIFARMRRKDEASRHAGLEAVKNALSVIPPNVAGELREALKVQEGYLQDLALVKMEGPSPSSWGLYPSK